MKVSQTMSAASHDAYAADYDAQVQTYACHVAEVLFGLCTEFIQPDQRLLDVGIGSGLSAQLFAKAGLEIYGMDFSPAMLDICQAKRFTADLKQHDLLQLPWPYPSGRFEDVVCCGVLHFIPELEAIFGEVHRVLAEGGLFAFTTRHPVMLATDPTGYERQVVGEFEIFSHAPAYIETLLAQRSFTRLKIQRCFVGDDLFLLWVVGRQ